MGKDIGMYIQAGIGGLVLAAVLFITWVLMIRAADGFHQRFNEYCSQSGQTFTRIYLRTDGTDELNTSAYSEMSQTSGATTCTAALMPIAVITAAGYSVGDAPQLYSEHNEPLGNTTGTVAATGIVAHAISASKWNKPLPILVPYKTLSVTMLSTVPVIASALFLAIAGSSLYRTATTSMSMVSTGIIMTIGSVVVIVVAFFFAPILMGFANVAYETVGGTGIQGGPLRITHMFGSILRIIFEFFAVVFIGATLLPIGTMGWKESGQYRSGM